MDAEKALRIGFALLVPGAAVFALRAGLAVFGVEPGDVLGVTPLTIVGGVLSLVGLGFAVVANWRGPDRIRTLLFAAVILIGHYIVRPLVPDFGEHLGAALVYWGTAAIASLRIRVAAWAGLVAALGALLRIAPGTNAAVGEAFIALGSGATAVFLAMAARGHRKP